MTSPVQCPLQWAHQQWHPEPALTNRHFPHLFPIKPTCLLVQARQCHQSPTRTTFSRIHSWILPPLWTISICLTLLKSLLLVVQKLLSEILTTWMVEVLVVVSFSITMEFLQWSHSAMESPRRTSLDYYDSIHDLLHVSMINYIRFFYTRNSYSAFLFDWHLYALGFFISIHLKDLFLKHCCFRHTRSYKQQRFYLYIDILYTDTRTEVQQWWKWLCRLEPMRSSDVINQQTILFSKLVLSLDFCGGLIWYFISAVLSKVLFWNNYFLFFI